MQSNQSKMNNKRVVVLGGSSGIGLAVAQQAAAQGAEVVIVSSNPARVEQAVATLATPGDGRAVDLMDERAIEKLFAGLDAIDHLVFTAGDSLQLSPLADTDLALARRAFELRFWSVLAAVKAAAPHIRPGGSITLTTGIAGPRPQKGWVVAASVCGTVDALARGLAVELAPIRVNAVSPGVVGTNLWQNMEAAQREALYETVGAQLPVGRVGDADDIAETFLYLMNSGFSTGQTVVVDGGTVLV